MCISMLAYNLVDVMYSFGGFIFFFLERDGTHVRDGEHCGVTGNGMSQGTGAQALSPSHDLCSFLQITPLLCPSNSLRQRIVPGDPSGLYNCLSLYPIRFLSFSPSYGYFPKITSPLSMHFIPFQSVGKWSSSSAPQAVVEAFGSSEFSESVNQRA